MQRGLAAAVAVLALAGCGGGSGSTATNTAAERGAPEPKTGGSLTVLCQADVDSIDPGVTADPYGLSVAYATQRPLYSHEPGNAADATPDLAAGPPRISADGRTVTVRLRRGVLFSPPVSREATSADVKYALERVYNLSVGSPYRAYFADIAGAAQAARSARPGRTPDIRGIQTPGRYTIRIELVRPRAAIVAAALALPVSAPVPAGYARRYDARRPSQYGTHQVGTGPYMIRNDESGATVGYRPGAAIELIRNPNWHRATDYRPAYLDTITFDEGDDPRGAARRVLSGRDVVSGDLHLPPQMLEQIAQGPAGSQLSLSPPTGGFQYIALDTRKPPFDDVNVRRAIAAAFDRVALRRAYGGALAGDIPTHVIAPGQPGYREAASPDQGPFSFMRYPGGNMKVAKAYMKRAGYSSGRYTGGEHFLAVANSAPEPRRLADTAKEQFAKLGFSVDLRFVSRQTMYARFCRVPADQPPVCPSVAWRPALADPEMLLDPTFDGSEIRRTGNANIANLDDPEINAAMARAEITVDRARRLEAWGAIDRMVTGQAPGILWLWEKQAQLRALNVLGVVNRTTGAWDLAFTSLS